MASAAAIPQSWTRKAAPMAAVGSLLFPAGIFWWLSTHPAADPSLVVPRQHFLIVSAVSLLAFGLAVLLAIAAVQIAQYRVLFLCLGFTAMGVTTIVLLLFSAWRQARAYLVARLPLQGVLVLSFLLLAQAQVIMMLGHVWRLSWWEYHGLMLLGVGLAVSSLAAQRAKGLSLRSVLEATLELEV